VFGNKPLLTAIAVALAFAAMRGRLALPARPLPVHVDLDIIDPGWLPGLRYPAPGGASPAAVTGVLRDLLATGQVAAIDIACTWHPGYGAAARVGPYLESALASSEGGSTRVPPS
jgi:Arginase family